MVWGAVLVCGMFILAGNAIAGGTLKLGFDSAGTVHFKDSNGTATSKDYDVNSGMSIAMEGFGTAGNSLDFGFGIELQTYREVKLTSGVSGGSFKFVPIYVLFRLHPEMSDFTPYLALQAGVSIFNADDKFKGYSSSVTTGPGGHLGVGIGAVLNKSFLMELLVTNDTGVLQVNGKNVLDVSYVKTTFSIGINF
jgi:hypothetical protein